MRPGLFAPYSPRCRHGSKFYGCSADEDYRWEQLIGEDDPVGDEGDEGGDGDDGDNEEDDMKDDHDKEEEDEMEDSGKADGHGKDDNEDEGAEAPARRAAKKTPHPPGEAVAKEVIYKKKAEGSALDTGGLAQERREKQELEETAPRGNLKQADGGGDDEDGDEEGLDETGEDDAAADEGGTVSEEDKKAAKEDEEKRLAARKDAGIGKDVGTGDDEL